jgi:polysaccharide export outer membrane protein
MEEGHMRNAAINANMCFTSSAAAIWLRSSIATITVAAGILTGCSSIPASGPSASQVVAAAQAADTGEGLRFALVDVNASIVTTMRRWSAASLQGTFGLQPPTKTQTIGVGDQVQITIWESGTGGLFSAPGNDSTAGGSRGGTIPDQMVGADGAITVPFAGRVQVVGRTAYQVEQVIVSALAAKALDPQVLVTVTRNVSNTVTVVGEVTTGARVPLTARGDRILDVVVQAGGTKAAPHETFVTLSRDGQSIRIPLQAVLTEPTENVLVKPGDVVAITREPQTFTAAGATGQNAVVPFDAIGITLDQAIARSGGLADTRADPGGVFVIRFERPGDYDQFGLSRPEPEPLTEVPVVYRINFRDPNSFFLARRFPMHNKDILFVSNAPAAELQKVMSIVWGFVGAGATIVAAALVIK